MRKQIRYVLFSVAALLFAIAAMVTSESAVALSFGVYTGLVIYYLLVLPFTVDYAADQIDRLFFEVVVVQLLQTLVLCLRTADAAIIILYAYAVVYATFASDYLYI